MTGTWLFIGRNDVSRLIKKRVLLAAIWVALFCVFAVKSQALEAGPQGTIKLFKPESLVFANVCDGKHLFKTARMVVIIYGESAEVWELGLSKPPGEAVYLGGAHGVDDFREIEVNESGGSHTWARVAQKVFDHQKTLPFHLLHEQTIEELLTLPVADSCGEQVF